MGFIADLLDSYNEKIDMGMIRDLSTWYDTVSEYPVENALKQAFKGYKVAWPTGFVVLLDKKSDMTVATISVWVEEHKTGKVRIHGHATIAIVFFEVYEDALAFYMTFEK